MATLNRKVQSSNLLTILLDGQEIGIMQTAKFSGDFGLTDESGIGDNVVVEYVPGVAHVSVSASGIVLIQKNLLSAGLMPSSSVRDILEGRVFDIGIYSQVSGAWLLKAIDCSAATIDVTVSTGKAVSFDATFKARDLAGTLLG